MPGMGLFIIFRNFYRRREHEETIIGLVYVVMSGSWITADCGVSGGGR